MKNKAYIISEQKFGEYLYPAVQSGYNMFCIKVDNINDYYYPSDVILDKPMSNSELWNLLDKMKIPSGMIFSNQHGRKILFDGTTLLPVKIEDKYICCKEDIWTLTEV